MLPSQAYPGLLIAVARRRIKQAVLARAARRGLSAQQFWLLVALHERPGASLGEVAARTNVDAPTASRVVAALARRKLVAAAPDPQDRRRALLHLTAGGQPLAADLALAAREIRDAVVEGMSAAEVEALRRGLRRVITNLERLDGRTDRSTP